MKNFVSTEWLKENIDKEDLIILDARAELDNPEKGLELYREGHIRGAHFVSLKDTMVGSLGPHGGRHPLPDMEKFIKDMMEIGVEDDSSLVIYDEGELVIAGRLWWLFKYVGKEKVYILEGGFTKWAREKGQIEKEIPETRKSKGLSLKLNESIRVGMEEVKSSIGREEVALVDARSYERYIGEVEPLDEIPGHIPSAINLPWMNLAEEGEVEKEELKKLLRPLFDFKEVIVYCGSGISGSLPYLLMDEIGLKPKLYSGSYSDWISYEENKIEIGEGRKII